MSHQITDISAIRKFVLSGNAYFTLRNTKRNTRLTFRFNTPSDQRNDDAAPIFASVLTGSDNTSNYTFVGTIWRTMNMIHYRHGRNSRIGQPAKSVQTILWLVRYINVNRQLPETVEFWHEGRCGRCGRKLTDPTSIESGFGPECITKVNR